MKEYKEATLFVKEKSFVSYEVGQALSYTRYFVSFKSIKGVFIFHDMMNR